jgi:uncharacterized protein
MGKEFNPDRLDAKAFVQAGVRLAGHDSLLKYERLAQEAKGLHPDLRVDWEATGECRGDPGPDGGQMWMHLRIQATFPMLCQRCLGPVDVPLQVDRWFRFVADESTAEALDDEVEEDLLALSREFDLHELIEDELLMALPVVPKHEVCPVRVPMASSDEDFEAASEARPNPFAALASMRVDKSDK